MEKNMLGNDKEAHFILSAILAFLLCIVAPAVLLPAMAALAFIVGIVFEIYQLQTGTGEFEWLDILADGLGVVTAFFAVYYYRKSQKN
jgi:hypothetical protein